VEVKTMTSARDLMTLAQAADELDVDPATLRLAIRNGKLEAEKLGPRVTMVTHEEVERYRRENHGKQGWAKRKDPDYTPSPMAIWARNYRARKRSTETGNARGDSV
jgi:hypothetical protein